MEPRRHDKKILWSVDAKALAMIPLTHLQANLLEVSWRTCDNFQVSLVEFSRILQEQKIITETQRLLVGNERKSIEVLVMSIDSISNSNSYLCLIYEALHCEQMFKDPLEMKLNSPEHILSVSVSSYLFSYKMFTDLFEI